MSLQQESSRLRTVAALLILLACICFGGSASARNYEMGLSIFALLCLLVVIWSGEASKIRWPINWFILGFVSIVAVQLMPLPHMVWSGMPQGQFAESLTPESGPMGTWQTLSIAPDATLYSLVAAVPALIALWLASGLSHSEQSSIASILVVAVFFQALIGIAQAADVLTFNIYNYHHPKVAIGFFASRNHFADLIIVGTSLLFAFRQSWSRRYGPLLCELNIHIFLIVFLLAVVGSASRAGLTIFAFVAITGYALSLQKRTRISFLATAFIFGLVLWLIADLIPQTGIIKTTFTRFESIDDARWDIWKFSWFTSQSYWPWGSGFGQFRLAYEELEPLRSVTPHYINAAHSEYIQLVIEVGIIGVIFSIVSLIILISYLRREFISSISIFSILGLCGIGTHAIVDYPFRVMALNVVVVFLLAFLISRKVSGDTPPQFDSSGCRLCLSTAEHKPANGAE